MSLATVQVSSKEAKDLSSHSLKWPEGQEGAGHEKKARQGLIAIDHETPCVKTRDRWRLR